MMIPDIKNIRYSTFMGTHGQGVLADVVMGGTARRVIRSSQKPALVIRLPEDG